MSPASAASRVVLICAQSNRYSIFSSRSITCHTPGIINIEFCYGASPTNVLLAGIFAKRYRNLSGKFIAKYGVF